jgi:hypothetical protein
MDKTAAAIRQQRHRDRRARGFFCLTVEVGTADILGLVDRGLLDRIHQDALTRVEEALHRFLDRRLAGVVSHE